MSIHPIRPTTDLTGGRSDDPFRASAGPRLRDRDPDPDPDTDDVDDLFDDLDESLDRYGSFDRDHLLAHRAVTPTLLSGLCWLDLGLCQTFHAVLFELLESVGDHDGLIATPGFFVDTGTRRMRAANAWLFDHPAPTGGDGSRSDRDEIADHSQELAIAVGTNPSLTFASTAALRERLLEGVLEISERDVPVTDEQIDWLTDLTLRLLSELRGHVITVGGCRVWAADVPADEVPTAS